VKSFGVFGGTILFGLFGWLGLGLLAEILTSGCFLFVLSLLILLSGANGTFDVACF
jgi:hypothetical protein